MRRAFVDLLDALVPCGDFAFLLPVGHFALHMAEVGDDAHELRVGEFAFVKRVGDVVPELENVARRHRPKFKRFVGSDFPTRADADHVVVVELALDHIAAIAFFDFCDEVSFLVVEFAAEFFLNDVEDWRVVEFVGRLGQVLAAVHALHHRRVLAGTGDDLVLGGAGSEPAVALEAEAGAEGAGFIFDAALDEEVVAENLCNSAVLLQQFAAFSRFFGEAVEKVECGAVWIHCRLGDEVVFG